VRRNIFFPRRRPACWRASAQRTLAPRRQFRTSPRPMPAALVPCRRSGAAAAGPVTAAITGVVSPAAPPKVPSREAQLKVAQSATDVPPP